MYYIVFDVFDLVLFVFVNLLIEVSYCYWLGIFLIEKFFLMLVNF